ncbi:MAG: hypothetical protein ACW981_02960 [Candidatus Hodarchaeales archaeon]|jgi:hypothetical protein
MNNPFEQVELSELKSGPEIIEELLHWLKLLKINVMIRRDRRDGAWVILTVWENAPDLFIELDLDGRNLSFYSSILTEFNLESPEQSYFNFLVEVLRIQSKYQTVRVCTGKSDEEGKYILKLYSSYRTRYLNNMQLIADLIVDGQNLMNEVQNLMMENKLPEIWREMEGEPAIEKYDLNFYYT